MTFEYLCTHCVLRQPKDFLLNLQLLTKTKSFHEDNTKSYIEHKLHNQPNGAFLLTEYIPPNGKCRDHLFTISFKFIGKIISIPYITLKILDEPFTHYINIPDEPSEHYNHQFTCCFGEGTVQLTKPIKNSNPISLRYQTMALLTSMLDYQHIRSMNLPPLIKKQFKTYKVHKNTKSADFQMLCDDHDAFIVTTIHTHTRPQI